ncbi:putative glycine-rich cell wall structural protein 1 [Solanum tuberosum]|uniref:putative glycine-rich cell wall structural protein 1 n=1 Tax=Solanum tuberosum TaxID=4113 RepID=UPI00073A40FC|nr:PREDICTED: putative glycine-rich cell wall structural protein 1 [Solanum tuberosum]
MYDEVKRAANEDLTETEAIMMDAAVQASLTYVAGFNGASPSGRGGKGGGAAGCGGGGRGCGGGGSGGGGGGGDGGGGGGGGRSDNSSSSLLDTATSEKQIKKRR